MFKTMIDLTIPQYDLDFSKPIEGKDVDKTIIEKKLQLWKQVLDLGLLTTGDTVTKARAFLLLEDPAIRAYANFRLNDKPVELYFYQDVLLNDKGKRILFIAANQMGKSQALDFDAALKFSTDHKKGWVGVLVSKSRDQSEYQMMRIKELLNSSNISYKEESTEETKTGKKDSGRTISFTFYDAKTGKPKYTNLLICCPPSGSALGYPCDEMWLDEFDYWENVDHRWFIKRVAIPRTFHTDGRISIYTNPNGAEGYAFSLWNETDDDGNPLWHRYRFNYWDMPDASEEGFKKRSAGMSVFEKQSTLLAEFGESIGAFFSRKEIDDSLDPELNDKTGYGNVYPVFFLDVGAKHDQSVLVGGFKQDNPNNPHLSLIKSFFIHKYPVGYPISRVVGAQNLVNPDDGWEDYANSNPSVKQILDDYAYTPDWSNEPIQPLFGCDVTGNSGIVPLFESVGVRAVDVTFSGPNKWKLYQRYKYLMEQRLFKRAPDRDKNTLHGRDFAYQASKLIVKKTGTRYRQIHHESDEDLDDTQDAAVGFIYLCDNPDLFSYSTYLVAYKGDDDESINDEYRAATRDLEGQYVPSWMKRGEVIRHRIRNRRVLGGVQ